HLQRDPSRPRLAERPLALDDLAERVTVDVFHDQVHGVVGWAGRDDVVQRDGVGVRQPGGTAGLRQRAPAEDILLRFADPGGRAQLLDRYLTPGQLVLAQPHRTHATAAQWLDQPVPADHQPPFHAPVTSRYRPASR